MRLSIILFSLVSAAAAVAGNPLDASKVSFRTPGSCASGGQTFAGYMDVVYDGWVVACEKGGYVRNLEKKVELLKAQVERAKQGTGYIDIVQQSGGTIWAEPSASAPANANPEVARLARERDELKSKLDACVQDAQHRAGTRETPAKGH